MNATTLAPICRAGRRIDIGEAPTFIHRDDESVCDHGRDVAALAGAHGPLTRADTRRVDMFAHKFVQVRRDDLARFDTVTSETMRDAFAGCVRPVRVELYPFVAARIVEIDAAGGEAVRRTVTCTLHRGQTFDVVSGPDFDALFYALSAIGSSMRAGYVGCPLCNALSGRLAETAPASLLDGAAPVEDSAPAPAGPVADAAAPLSLSIDGERVTVTGSVKGDAVHSALLPRPWVWSRNAVGYVLPRSLTPGTRAYRIDRLRAACERAGVALDVDDAGTVVSEAERRENRTERLEARADRHEAAAERAEHEADSRYRAFRSIADGIPMGQPILVGHHSERGHRAAIKRMDGHMEKMSEASREATRRAELAENLRRNLERGDSAVTIGNRIDKHEAELRKIGRRLEEGALAAKLSAQDPEKAARVAYAVRPIADGYRVRLEAERDRLTEAVELDRATVAAMVESGAVRVFDKTTVSKGDMVKGRHGWCLVHRANAKTVALVVDTYADGSPWVLNYPWREVSDHRTAAQVAEMKRVAEVPPDAS